MRYLINIDGEYYEVTPVQAGWLQMMEEGKVKAFIDGDKASENHYRRCVEATKGAIKQNNEPFKLLKI